MMRTQTMRGVAPPAQLWDGAYRDDPIFFLTTPRMARPRSRARNLRPAIVRALGAILLVGSLVGSAAVIKTPDARREVVEWITLGHASTFGFDVRR